MTYRCEINNFLGISGASSVNYPFNIGGYIQIQGHFPAIGVLTQEDLRAFVDSLVEEDVDSAHINSGPTRYNIVDGGTPNAVSTVTFGGPLTDYYYLFGNMSITYYYIVEGIFLNRRLTINIPEPVEVRVYNDFIRYLNIIGFDLPMSAEHTATPSITCVEVNNNDVVVNSVVTETPETTEVTHTIVDGDPGDIYITINAGEGSLAPFNDLDPFYQDRVRDTVERVLLETDGTSIREFALLSDFFHTSLETMDLNELVELLTHVATVGRD